MMAGSGLKDLLCCVSGKDYYVRAISLCSNDITPNNSGLRLSLSWEKKGIVNMFSTDEDDVYWATLEQWRVSSNATNLTHVQK